MDEGTAFLLTLPLRTGGCISSNIGIDEDSEDDKDASSLLLRSVRDGISLEALSDS